MVDIKKISLFFIFTLGLLTYTNPVLALDTDGDGIPNATDNCRTIYNPRQGDLDGDGRGNLCDADRDGDGVTRDIDCNDLSSTIHPGVAELCSDGLDNDCNGVLDCGILGTISLSSADAVFVGEDAGDNSGVAVAGVGDFNADGLDDILIGAYARDNSHYNSGTSYLLFPTLSASPAVSSFTGTIDLSVAPMSFTGENENDYSGYALSQAGDVNGDGYQDFIIGIYNSDAGASSGGAAAIIYGTATPAATTVSLTNADVRLINDTAFEHVGYSVAGVGDVNNDGFDDVLIGGQCSSSSPGVAYLIYGSSTLLGDFMLSSADAKFVGDTNGDNAGEAVAGAGDFNGDGYDDILIGADYSDIAGADSGTSYLFFGGSLSGTVSVNTANLILTGQAAGDASGYSVAGVGDVNNDGLDDIMMGAIFNDNAGANTGSAYLVYGSSTLSGTMSLSAADVILNGTPTDNEAADSVAGAGDINGDGFAEVFISSPYYGAGKTYLMYGGHLSGTIDLTNADATFTGVAIGDAAGYSNASAGDVNGDGFDDILISARFNDDGGSNAGATYLIYGE